MTTLSIMTLIQVLHLGWLRPCSPVPDGRLTEHKRSSLFGDEEKKSFTTLTTGERSFVVDGYVCAGNVVERVDEIDEKVDEKTEVGEV